MDIKDDLLYQKIDNHQKEFKKQARSHKRLKRFLWTISSVLTVGLALCANFTFDIFGITSSGLTKLISIIVPVVTGYSILRSPESLWIMEIEMRNRLSDLKDRFQLKADRNPEFDRSAIEEEYFQIMEDANRRWLEIKDGNTKQKII